MTKTKTTTTVKMDSSPGRQQLFANNGDASLGPGRYGDRSNFGSNAKGFTIGERRETRVNETMGPGSYSPERADALTKTRTVTTTVNMSSTSPGRNSFARKADIDVAPGQYDAGKSFGSDAKGFIIGERREQRIESTIGPGSYDITDT